jgi:hypothetical protein
MRRRWRTTERSEGRIFSTVFKTSVVSRYPRLLRFCLSVHSPKSRGEKYMSWGRTGLTRNSKDLSYGCGSREVIKFYTRQLSSQIVSGPIDLALEIGHAFVHESYTIGFTVNPFQLGFMLDQHSFYSFPIPVSTTQSIERLT